MLLLLFWTIWRIGETFIYVLIPQGRGIINGLGGTLIVIFGIILLFRSLNIRINVPVGKILKNTIKGIINFIGMMITFIAKISRKIYESMYRRIFKFLKNKGFNLTLAKTISIIISLIILI